jgi:hypothetical protein
MHVLVPFPDLMNGGAPLLFIVLSSIRSPRRAEAGAFDVPV